MTSNATMSPDAGENSTAIAAANQAAYLVLLGVWQQEFNEQTGKYYAAAMSAGIVIFTISHWSRFFFSRYAARGLKESKIMKAQVSITRLSRYYLNRPVPGFTSLGHALVVFLYLVVNLILTVTNTLWIDNNLVPIGNRMGWMAMLNLAFITVLALKNTPLAFMTGYSYESLNYLHQVGGYTTIICGFLHATLECVAWSRRNKDWFLRVEVQIHGMIALGGFFVILVTALTMRKLRYELFYIVHITMYMLILINLGLHRPYFDLKPIIIILFAAAIWSLDRVFRGSRILWNSKNTQAIIYPLSNRGTRIVLRRSSSRTTSGTHCFLWIPKLRLIETHPFTIVSTSDSSLDLVIAAYDGFTNDLHKYAVKNPGVALRASIDGPYGALPDFGKVANKIILIAGGSGASFTFGVALDMIKKVPDPESSRLSIDFVWTVREADNISWFREELTELQRNPRVSLFLHTTRAPSSAPLTLTLPISDDDDEKNNVPPSSSVSKTDQNHFSADIEKINHSSSTIPTSLPISHGRPDIHAFIKDVVGKTDNGDRIVVASCGPDEMMRAVREATADCIMVGGPSVELYCEQFGW